MSHSIEEVDKQVEELQNLHGQKLASGSAITQICSIVTIATPILKFVRAILFFKPKWQKIIDQVIGVAELACGSTDS